MRNVRSHLSVTVRTLSLFIALLFRNVFDLHDRTAANQDRTESPLSINHYSTLYCLSVQCSDTSSDLQPKDSNVVTLKELLHPLTKSSHLQTLRDLKW